MRMFGVYFALASLAALASCQGAVVGSDPAPVDAAPLCPIGTSTCNGGTTPGTSYYVFEAVATLPQRVCSVCSCTSSHCS